MVRLSPSEGGSYIENSLYYILLYYYKFWNFKDLSTIQNAKIFNIMLKIKCWKSKQAERLIYRGGDCRKWATNGEARSNTIKFNLLSDGAIQIYVSNGDHIGYFRLYEKQQKELRDWLQRNIK